jgi:hypothetical protein
MKFLYACAAIGIIVVTGWTILSQINQYVVAQSASYKANKLRCDLTDDRGDIVQFHTSQEAKDCWAEFNNKYGTDFE